MSQFQQPSFQQPTPRPSQAPRQDNPLGLTGFIISLVGLVLCGIPSIIGIIVSGLGLKKEPKGFAIAGLLIGVFGLIELGLVGFLAYSTYQLAGQAGGAIRKAATQGQLSSDAFVIGEQWEETGTLPTQAEGDELVSGSRDIYANSIRYETDGITFSLRSAGPDGVFDNEDDIIVGPFEDPESATFYEADDPFDDDFFSDMQDKIEEADDFNNQ